MVLTTERRGDVRLVRWDDGGDNRLNPTSLRGWHSVLDEIEGEREPLALVVTGAGRFFSNGLDLDWMGANPERSAEMLDEVHRLFGRILVTGCYTVAAINGHAFGAGAILATGFDLRIMRTGRGFWCMPEADMGLPVTEPMLAGLVRVPAPALHDALMTSRRFTAEDALAAGIVNEVAAEDELVDRAVERAGAMTVKSRATIAEHKRLLYAEAAAVCGVTGGDPR